MKPLEICFSLLVAVFSAQLINQKWFAVSNDDDEDNFLFQTKHLKGKIGQDKNKYEKYFKKGVGREKSPSPNPVPSLMSTHSFLDTHIHTHNYAYR